MRDLFPGHYNPTEKQFKKLWREAIFVFDANILLNIYRYSEKTREEFFQILSGLEGRVWLPHQVALEFQENRLDVLSNRRRDYEKIKTELKNTVLKARKAASDIIDGERKSSPLRVDLEKAFDMLDLNSSIEEGVAFLDKQIAALPELRGKDALRDKVDALFDGLIGMPDENVEAKYKEAKRRCEAKIPPGYKDHKKEESRRYNDAVAWLQTLEFAKEKQKSIVFVTDDTKEDWFLSKEGQTIGPRPELVQEMLVEAKVSFYLYTGPSFIEWGAKQLFSSSSSPSQDLEAAIKEAREVQKESGRISWNEYLEAGKESVPLYFDESLERELRSAVTRPRISAPPRRHTVHNDYKLLSNVANALKLKISDEKDELENHLSDFPSSLIARELTEILERLWHKASSNSSGIRRVLQNVETLREILDVEVNPHAYSVDRIRALLRMGTIVKEDELAIRAYVIRERLSEEQNNSTYLGEIPWPAPLYD